MSADEKKSDVQLQDEQRLNQLGYKQELHRSLSSFANFGIAFTILSVPTALLPLIYLGMTTGGPASLLISWPIIAVLSFLVGLSISEIVSAYPTSGGLYYWAANLAGPKRAPIFSYFTGWFNFLGLWGITSGTAFGFGQIFATYLYTNGSWNTTDIPTTDMRYKGVVVASSAVSLLIVALLGKASSRTLNYFAQGCLGINIVGLLVMGFGTAFMGNVPRTPLPTLITTWVNTTGFSDAWAAFVGILPAALTYSGYDSAAHLAEETVGAARAGPKAILISMAVTLPVGFLMGWSLLAPVPIDQYSSFANSPVSTSTVIDIFFLVGGNAGGLIMTTTLFIVFVTGVYSMAITHSRMTYAFARDGGLPGSKFLYVLDAASETPVRALWITLFLDFIIIIPSLYSSALYAAINSVGTIGTYLCYAIPIFLRIVRDKEFPRGPFNLGRFGLPVAVVAFIWLLIACVALSLPTVNVVSSNFSDYSSFIAAYLSSFNWAPVMVVGIFLIALIIWVVSARHWFKGPKLDIKTIEAFSRRNRGSASSATLTSL
ncbi:amino acid/polyamine transporter I [Polychytrium aggregatum]|uniref:amino acid/polyamine transporter I n=1 Tax=Polychytrium aggregatum TaxID=110093 RepID=UPI0022FF0A50|nr:amino acid/polyamine transporter I [Polychytrium aggregatum]KAI9208848.1 amino acid/polyamine transporter I [Polychytrium aggregatum]